MFISDINPYVRFARRSEHGFTEDTFVACDHRIFYCEEGAAEVYIEGVKYNISGGDIIYWKSGTNYRVICDRSAVITGCNFDFTQEHKDLSSPIGPVKSGEDIVCLEDVSFEDTDVFDRSFIACKAYKIKNIFLAIADEYDRKQIYYAQKISAMLKEALIDSMRLVKNPHDSKSSRLAQDVLDYIRQNYYRKLTNEEIGLYFNYHPNYLNNLVVRHTGKSMHRYLLEYKMNTAVNLLQYDSLSVSEAAVRVGIPDIKHFSKLFKEIIGVSPSKFNNL